MKAFKPGDRVFYLESVFDKRGNMLLGDLTLGFGTIKRAIKNPVYGNAMKYEITCNANTSLDPYDSYVWGWYYHEHMYTDLIKADYVFESLNDVLIFLEAIFKGIKEAMFHTPFKLSEDKPVQLELPFGRNK